MLIRGLSRYQLERQPSGRYELDSEIYDLKAQYIYIGLRKQPSFISRVQLEFFQRGRSTRTSGLRPRACRHGKSTTVLPISTFYEGAPFGGLSLCDIGFFLTR